MKPSKRKSVSKSSTTETKCDCVDNVILGVVLTALAVMGIVLAYNLLSGPKFEMGECVLNRAGETYKVMLVGDSTYTFFPQEYRESYYGWYTSSDYKKDTQYRDIEYADEHYIEIPCER